MDDVLRRLVERLVEVDLAIEDLDGWATQPADREKLARLEELRDEIRAGLRHRYVSRQLLECLEQAGFVEAGKKPAESEPRD